MKDTDEASNNDGAGLMTEPEAARYLGVCTKTVFNHRKAGRLRGIKIGTSVRYDRADLAAFVEACRLAV